MKTQQELQLHYWGPLYDMVKEYNAKHGCDVKPWECVVHLSLIFGSGKVYHKQEFTEHPDFELPLDKSGYTFALTILYDDKRKEHRPVFVGDTLFSKKLTNISIVVGLSTEHLINDLNCSWSPPMPKRTFKIGDKELPCPERRDVGGFNTFVCGEPFLFDTPQDCNEFKEKLIALITAARDKE